MYFDLSFSCLCSLKKDTYKSIWREGVSINSEETKNFQSHFAPRSAIRIRRARTIYQRIFKDSSHYKMWYELSEQLKRQGTFYIGS